MTCSPRSRLGQLPQVAGVDDAGDRVAAGRAVVGEQHDGSAVGRDLDRAQHRALAGQLALGPRQGGPGQSQPDPVGGRAHRPRGRRQPGEDVRVEPAGMGSGQDAYGIGGRRAGRVQRRGYAERAADRQPVTGHDRGGPHPGQGVGGARAQHRRDVDAAGDGEVGAHPGRGRAEGERLPRSQPDRLTVGHPSSRASVTVESGLRHGAGHRDPAVEPNPDRQPAQQHLQHGRVGGVADQPVGERGGRAVQSARPRDTEMGVAVPAAVLDQHLRAGRDDGQHGDAPPPRQVAPRDAGTGAALTGRPA